MIDKSPEEEFAIENGSNMGGEYIESIKKTDLAEMSREEWLTLCEVIITGYQDQLMRTGNSFSPLRDSQ